MQELAASQVQPIRVLTIGTKIRKCIIKIPKYIISLTILTKKLKETSKTKSTKKSFKTYWTIIIKGTSVDAVLKRTWLSQVRPMVNITTFIISTLANWSIRESRAQQLALLEVYSENKKWPISNLAAILCHVLLRSKTSQIKI